MAATIEIRSPKKGAYTWVLSDRGRTLAVGATYTRKASCQKAVESFRKGAATAPVADRSEPAKPPANTTRAKKGTAQKSTAQKSTRKSAAPRKRR